MGLDCEEAEMAALDRQEWRRNVAQCVHTDVDGSRSRSLSK